MSTQPRVLSDRYQVGELIGQGGMARVYRGTDLTLGREVAIKILDRDLARDAAFRNRFRLEAQSASRMAHPSIVRVFDAGEDTETDSTGTHPVPYIVMELVEGEQLKEVIARGPVSLTDTIHYVDGILEALEYSHRAGVVHRDIKPGNVMVTKNGAVKVMDFGIARAVSDSSSTVAETTQIIGTAAYFSPEQAKGEQVDARADLYSTGVVLYELLAGRQPFRGESPVAIAYQHVSETPLSPSEVSETAPRSLDPVVLRALAKDPFQRYPDAATFRASLDAAVSGKEPSKKQLGALTNELYGPSPRQAAETARSLRQLSTDTTMTRTQSGPPVAWIWAGVALLAVLLASVLIWVLTMSPKTESTTNTRTVPNLTGMTYERALIELNNLDLSASRESESSTEVSKGNVIRSEPTAGTSLEAGQTVNLIVSTGAEMTTVPLLVGLSQEAAQEALEKVGLVVGAVTLRNDPQLNAGTVIEASAEADTQITPGSTVSLVVASGVVTLKDLTGWPIDAAQEALEEIGLTGNPVPDANCKATVPETVSTMSIAPGDVPVRSTIDLRFCSGS